MKKSLSAFFFILLLCLSACSNHTSSSSSATNVQTAKAELETDTIPHTTEALSTTEVPTTVPQFDLEGFRAQISELHMNIMDNSLAVGNLGKFENQYWENMDNIAGTKHGSDFSETLYAKGVAFYEEKSGTSFDDVISKNDTIRDQYKAIVLVSPEGEEAVFLKDTITKLYDAYTALYTLTTQPNRASRNAFAADYNEYLKTIIAEDGNIKLFLDE